MTKPSTKDERTRRRSWQTPQLRSADIKQLTAGGQGSGADAGTMFGMMMLSDSRLKRDIIFIGESGQRIPMYAFRYIWGGPVRIGTMAQDVIHLAPQAIRIDEVGLLLVDYAQLDIDPVAIPA